MGSNMLFHSPDSYNECEVCKRILPRHYDKTICPHCEENQLFNKVKDFIRSNDVNEYEVANHFNIPIRQVKAWIREGRIEYKDSSTSNIMAHCQRCGASISFGSLCPKCLKLLNGNKGYNISPISSGSSGSMRFLDDEIHL